MEEDFRQLDLNQPIEIVPKGLYIRNADYENKEIRAVIRGVQKNQYGKFQLVIKIDGEDAEQPNKIFTCSPSNMNDLNVHFGNVPANWVGGHILLKFRPRAEWENERGKQSGVTAKLQKVNE